MFSMKKALFLATTALTVFAVAAPASAWATSEWSQEGQPLTSKATLGLEGTVSIRSEGSAIFVQCTVNNSLNITPGSAGELAEVLIEPEGCATMGEYAGEVQEICQDAVEEAYSQTRGVHTENQEIHWNNFTFDLVMNRNCNPFPLDVMIFEGGELTATPNNVESMNELTLSGWVGSGFGDYEVTGHLNVTPAETYGIS
jgi:hypothetical protein